MAKHAPPQPLNKTGTEDTLFQANQEGLYLKDTVLHLDSPQNQSISFLSNAKVAASSQFKEVLTTEKTADLLKALYPKAKTTPLICPFLRNFSLGQLSLNLIPAGYMLGSASILVKHQGKSIFYLKEIQPKAHPLTEKPMPTFCDLLIYSCDEMLAAKSENPKQSWDVVKEDLLATIKQLNENGANKSDIVIFTPTIHIPQQIEAHLQENGFRIWTHPLFQRLNSVYHKHLPEDASKFEKIQQLRARKKREENDIIVWPTQYRSSPTLLKLGQYKSIQIQEASELHVWASKERQPDVIYTLEQRPNLLQTVDYIESCAPKHITLYGENTLEIEGILKERGHFSLNVLSPRRQLNLF